MSTKNPLSKLIVSECDKRGWKAPDLHRNADISRSAAYRIYNGAGAISIQNISRVLYILNLIDYENKCDKNQSQEIERLNKLIDRLLKEIERLEKSS